jgi:hypothetical protein
VHHYKVVETIQVGLPITNLAILQGTDADFLLCSGHFNSLKVFFRGKVRFHSLIFSSYQLYTQYHTADWIHTMAVGDIDNDEQEEVVVGLMNNSLLALRLIQ